MPADKKIRSVDVAVATPSKKPIEELRGELLSVERLLEHAVEQGHAHAEPILSSSKGPLRERFAEARQQIREAYEGLTAQASQEHDPSPAEEWLLDNSHVVDEQLREIEEDLPAGYLVKLPRLTKGPYVGFPRVYALCIEYVRHTDARIDLETLAQYVLAYQTVHPLTIGELWAIPIMLRMGLILIVGALATSEANGTDRASADAWAAKLLAASAQGRGPLQAELRKLEQKAPLPAFLVQLVRRLREHDASSSLTEWVRNQCVKLGGGPEELARQQHLRQAADQVSVGNAITSMRAIGALDWNKFFERTSVVEELLRGDPGAAYTRTDGPTRDRCRHAVEDIARRSDATETGVAEAALGLARRARDAKDAPGLTHVGYWLIDEGRAVLERQVGYRQPSGERLRRRLTDHATLFYLGSLGLIVATLLGLAAGAWIAIEPAGTPAWLIVVFLALLAIPATEVAMTLLNSVVTAIFPPRLLARLDFDKGIDPDCQTLVVVPCLIDTATGVKKLASDLEIRALANWEEGLYYALVTDFTDHLEETAEKDSSVIDAAIGAIERLNERHCRADAPRFFLFHRKRLHNPSEARFMGWERKRGKLEELNRLLRGGADTTFTVVTAPASLLPKIRYVITLDADTALPRESARRLVATMAHPLNRARANETGRVERGYGVLQPRVGTRPISARQSLFAKLHAGQSGIDPYTTAVSDVYQDLFAEGSYVGKGIYDVDAFDASLQDRVPDNALLSHDLFEGAHARTAYVTDIELLDDQPASYEVAVGRQHRWVRGDWQLLPWLLPRSPRRSAKLGPNDLSLFSRYRIFDNLRRSLLAPSLVLLLMAGWASGPAVAAVATLATMLVVGAPIYTSLAIALARRLDDARAPSFVASLRNELVNNGAQAALGLVFLLDRAVSMVHAIGVTLYRLYGSKKNLLEWQTTNDAEKRFAAGKGYGRRLLGTALASGIALVLLTFAESLHEVLPYAAPFLLLWVVAPFAAARLSKPIPARDRSAPLQDEDFVLFRGVARQTWRFFETYVGAEDHFLPPDNFQEAPKGVLARRTSPTNIGLYLLSVVSARDLGFTALGDVATRLSDTLDTLDKLEKREGHILNWYDTATLRPLDPHYVSTVDSGNLVAYLWTLTAACGDLGGAPIAGPPQRTSTCVTAGLAELDAESRLALDALRKRAFELPESLSDTAAFLEELRTKLPALKATDRAFLDLAVQDAERILQEIHSLAPWVAVASKTPRSLDNDVGHETLQHRLGAIHSPRAIVDAAPELLATIDALSSETSAEGKDHYASLRRAIEESARACQSIMDALTRIGARAAMLANNTNFKFLFDEGRGLFSIGYNVGSARLDASHYDLLASEARLASIVAIAKGDAPQEHWFRLGRPRSETSSGCVLLSWSGSMFEYLMPLLVTKTYEQTLLDETYESAVMAQQEYARTKGVPWGISESAYNLMDLSMTYQYHAFGTPGLGLKAGLAEDLVVAPYATGLATLVRPDLAVANFRALAKEGLLGAYGYYESIDYSPTHVPPGRRGVVVKTYMAHHQGMTLVALANVLCGSPMQKRFHSDARVKATELLLEERIPTASPMIELRSAAIPTPTIPEPEVEIVEHVGLAEPGLRSHVLGYGDVSSIVTQVGTGSTSWKGLDLVRYRDDGLTDPQGIFFYVRDLSSSDYWSAGRRPARRSPDQYSAAFAPDRVEIRRRDGDIETLMEIVSSPEHPVEVRRLTFTNHGSEARELEVTTYAEMVLATRSADVAHRAFSGLFVETEAIREGLVAHRHPRASSDQHVWLAQVLAFEPGEWSGDELETSRSEFVGRGRTVASPQALSNRKSTLSGKVGFVLDPILSMRRRTRIEPGKNSRIALATIAGSTRESVLELASSYGTPHTIQRTFELASADARVELRHLGISSGQAALFQRVLSALLDPKPAHRFMPSDLPHHGRLRDALWPQGISGDLPILLVRLDEGDFADMGREVLLSHEYLRLNGVSIDLVFLNEEPGGYLQPLQDQAQALIESSPAQAHMNQRGGVFVCRADSMPPERRALLLGAARLVLRASEGSLSRQLRKALQAVPVLPPALQPVRRETELADAAPLSPCPAKLFDNGIGGFSEDGKEYIIDLPAGRATPAPWCNVLANASFGSVISERGGGFTWAGNSQRHRLTQWSNDTVSDPVSEAIYVRDDENGQYWSATPGPSGDGISYRVRHGQGYSTFEHSRAGLEVTLTVFVAAADPVKVSKLRIVNHSKRKRQLSVYGLVEWVVGSSRETSRHTVLTSYAATTSTVLAHNPGAEHTDRRAFYTSTVAATSMTCDREEFLGTHGSRRRPGALARTRLAGCAGAGLDPCAALQCEIVIQANETAELAFVLGEAADKDQALALAADYQRDGRVESALREVNEAWDRALGTITVKTPERALDLLVNRWLLYQSLSSRFWGRSAFYQSGGAYGFRDQLQDVMAFVHSNPQLARRHILLSATRQFTEGDVQHWWHPESGEGVRTRCSDDMLWLPYITAQYVRATGDRSILDEKLPFLQSRRLEPKERDLFLAPTATQEAASLYEHCTRALDIGNTRGENGLPLIQAGDWNDGMDRVGEEGKGTSVWLAWFLIRTLRDFQPIAQALGDVERARWCASECDRISAALDAHAWDGQWYRRGTFDDGTPLGSKQSTECKIDAIAQSWAVIAGTGDPARAATALDSSVRELFREDDGLMLLFSPPFEKTRDVHDPGYIGAYPPGVRENGGQYTHGVLWTILAEALRGDGDRAMHLMSKLLPIHHALDKTSARRYAVEPYVVAADVYGPGAHLGRGGWTWYTGSAAWMYRIALENLLGIQLREGRLSINPTIPKSWPRYEIVYRCESGPLHITVENPNRISSGSCVVEVDGKRSADGTIPLVGAGRERRVRVTMFAHNASATSTPAGQSPTGAEALTAGTGR